MWPRAVEIVLGVWLWLAPFIFGHQANTPLLLIELASGLAIIVLAALAVAIRHLHFAQLLICLWLMLYGYFAGGYPAPHGYQNLIITGMLLSFFAIIPSDCLQPPRRWQDFYGRL